MLFRSILAVKVPDPLCRRIEHFASQFEYYEYAAAQLEYKTKDTVKLSGVEFHQLDALDTGKDKVKDLGLQTRNGLSVRALMTVLVYVKAMAWFRGDEFVTLEDIRQVLPFVLHDKLTQNADAPYFEQGGQAVYRVDRIGWLRQLFDLSCQEFDRLNLDKEDPVARFDAEFQNGLDGLPEAEVRKRLAQIERTLEAWAAQRKVIGPRFDDILKLKYLHQRYTNYLHWLVNKP